MQVLENTAYILHVRSGYRLRKRCCNSNGFTLLELLLVILLISLMAGVGGLSYAGTYKKMLVEKNAKQLALMVKYARISAVEQQKKFMIKLDENTKSFFMLQGDQQVSDIYSKPVKFTGDVVFELIKIEPLASQVPTEQQSTITFQPDGTAQTSIVQIGDGNSHMTVSVEGSTARAAIYYGKTDQVKIRTIDLDDQWN